MLKIPSYKTEPYLVEFSELHRTYATPHRNVEQNDTPRKESQKNPVNLSR